MDRLSMAEDRVSILDELYNFSNYLVAERHKVNGVSIVFTAGLVLHATTKLVVSALCPLSPPPPSRPPKRRDQSTPPPDGSYFLIPEITELAAQIGRAHV